MYSPKFKIQVTAGMRERASGIVKSFTSMEKYRSEAKKAYHSNVSHQKPCAAIKPTAAILRL